MDPAQHARTSPYPPCVSKAPAGSPALFQGPVRSGRALSPFVSAVQVRRHVAAADRSVVEVPAELMELGHADLSIDP